MENRNRTEIATLGEFGLIERLTADMAPINESTHKGVGDDAAVLHYEGHETLVTTDLLLEGVHFDLTRLAGSIEAIFGRRPRRALRRHTPGLPNVRR